MPVSVIALARRIDRATLRRAALFLIDVGVPLLIGVALGAHRAALLGTVAGMLLSFADNDQPLLGRLHLLLMAGGCMAVGGLVGYGLHLHEIAFWVAFVLAAFAVGWVTRYGREPLLASRNGVLAFAVAAGFPMLDVSEVITLVGVLALVATARTIDHLVFGPLPLLRGTPVPQAPSGHWGWARYAFAYAAAAGLALWIGLTYEPVRAVWVVVTTLVVMQPDARASFRRIGERTLGTFLGVFVVWAVTSISHSVTAICAAVLMVAPFVPHHATTRYWAHTALIAVLVLLAYDLINIGAGDINELLMERLKDMLIGCAVALAGTAVAFAWSREPVAEEGENT
jgi:uncharacterized RmlC-like cupin family protein